MVKEHETLVIPDLVYEKIAELSKIIGHSLAHIPLYIGSKSGPPAYTSSQGIWISERVIKHDPDNVHVYLVHEIFHGVVTNHVALHKYSPAEVNVITDYKINELLYKLYGYNVHKVRYKGCLNKKWFGLSLAELGEQVRAKHFSGLPAACGQEFVPHPAIVEIAAALRKKHASLLDPVPPIFYLTSQEEKIYSLALKEVKTSAIVYNTLPIDAPLVLKSLWYALWYETPKAIKSKAPVLHPEQALVFCSESAILREKVSGKSTYAMFAALKLLKALDYDKGYRSHKESWAAHNVQKLKDTISMLSSKKKKTRAKLELKLKEADRKLVKAKAMKPLAVLFNELPVEKRRATDYVKPVTLSSAFSNKAVLTLPEVRMSLTTKRIAALGRFYARDIERTIDLAEDLKDALGPDFDMSVNPPDVAEDDEDDKSTGKSKAGKRKSKTTASQDVDVAEEGEQVVKAEGVKGRAAGKANTRSKNAINFMESLSLDFNRIQHILEYAKEVETLINKISKVSTKLGDSGPDVMYEYGNDVTRMVQNEAAYLALEHTKLHFLVNLASHQLLQTSPLEKKRQAVILCLDTSGSMYGHYYTLAAGFCLAVLKYMMKENRGVALLTFDTQVKGAVVADVNEKVDMHEMLRVILAPSYGGTSFDRALMGAQEIRDEHNWKSCTTFMVTDGYDYLSNADEILANKHKNDRIVATVVSNSAGDALAPVADEIKHVTRKLTSLDLVNAAKSIF